MKSKFLAAGIALAALAVISVAAWAILCKPRTTPDPGLQAALEHAFGAQEIRSAFTASRVELPWSQGVRIEFQPAEAAKPNHGRKEVLLLPLAIAGHVAARGGDGVDWVEIRSVNQDEDFVRARADVRAIRRFVAERQSLEVFADSVEFETIPWQAEDRKDRNHARQYLDRGRLFANQKGQFEKALGLFEEAERLAPDDYDVQFALAMTHWVLGRNDEAIRRLEKIRESHPEEYRTYPALARCLVTANRGAEARAALVKFDALRPSGPGPYPQAALYQAAQAHLELGNTIQALGMLKDFVRLYPDHAEGRYLLGKTLLDSGDPKQAHAEFRRAASLNPDSAWLCQELGWNLASLKDLETGASMYRRSYTLGNRDVSVFVGLSYCYDRLGRLFDAKYVVVEGMKRFPANADLERNFRAIHRTIVKRGLRPSGPPAPIELTGS